MPRGLENYESNLIQIIVVGKTLAGNSRLFTENNDKISDRIFREKRQCKDATSNEKFNRAKPDRLFCSIIATETFF